MNEPERVSCAILGGMEKDLFLLSEVHRQPSIEIRFVYETRPGAVALEIAEILGIERITSVENLPDLGGLDYAILTEPRERFTVEMERLKSAGVRVLSPEEALELLCKEAEGRAEADVSPEDSYSIVDTLKALEKLFDRRELLRFLLEAAVRSAGASAGSIMLYSREASELYIGYAFGLSERVIRTTHQKLGQGIAGQVAQERKPRIIRLKPEAGSYDRERVRIGSAISVPLIWEGKLIGVLNVSSGEGEHELDERDLDRLKVVSRSISKVLFESLKVEEVQVRHREQHLRATVGELSEKAIPFQEKFYMLSQYLAELLEIDTVEIYLNTSEGDWFLLGGSNSRFSTEPEKVRCSRGAMSRCFMEQRTIILAEQTEREGMLLESLSSLIYQPITLVQPLGVLVTEFSDRMKLEEFLFVKDSISLEIARFVSSELKAARMRRERDTMAMVSRTVPSLLAVRKAGQLADLLAESIAEAVGCAHVSVRLHAEGVKEPSIFRYTSDPSRWEGLEERDRENHERVAKLREPFSEAKLSFEPALEASRKGYQSVLSIPIIRRDTVFMSICAYDKRSSDPLLEAVFTDFDREVVEQLAGYVVPVAEALLAEEPLPWRRDETSYDALLEENLRRLLKTCSTEIVRSERYHHPFTLLLFKIKPLGALFQRDRDGALTLVEDITEGIKTRTRKTDYLSWIDCDTFALLSLEAERRVRFLVSRIVLYLTKDLAESGKVEWGEGAVSIGRSSYPGIARTAEEMLEEARINLKSYPAE